MDQTYQLKISISEWLN